MIHHGYSTYQISLEKRKDRAHGAVSFYSGYESLRQNVSNNADMILNRT